MRITSLDKANSLSYDLPHTGGNLPSYLPNAYEKTLFASSQYQVHTNPTPDIGTIPFIHYADKNRQRASANILSSTSLNPEEFISFGTFIPATEHSLSFGYAVETSLLVSRSQDDIIAHTFVGHLNTNASLTITSEGTAVERHNVRIISRSPINTNSNNIHHYYDAGLPTLSGSNIYFGISLYNKGTSPTNIQKYRFDISIWRQHAPHRIVNDWQA